MCIRDSMYPLAEDTSKNLGPNSWKYVSPMYPLGEDMSKIYARPLPRMLFFCLPLSIQPRLNTQQQGRAGGRHTGGARPCCCVLSLGWLLNGKQKNSIYSWQRTGIFLTWFHPYIFIQFDLWVHAFLSNLICESIHDHNLTKYQIFGDISDHLNGG